MRQVRWYNRDVFSIFFNMKVYCVFTLEAPQRGDSNEYSQYTISQYKKETHPKLSQICNYGICSKGPKKEFEPSVVNEPSVFEPLKFYCIVCTFTVPLRRGYRPSLHSILRHLYLFLQMYVFILECVINKNGAFVNTPLDSIRI